MIKYKICDTDWLIFPRIIVYLIFYTTGRSGDILDDCILSIYYNLVILCGQKTKLQGFKERLGVQKRIRGKYNLVFL